MRIWQWSFWEVLTLLLTTYTQVHSTEPPDYVQKTRTITDEHYRPTSTSFPDLTQTLKKSENSTNKKENSESNQLVNYKNISSHHKRTHALSNNNNSHPTPLPFSAFQNESLRHAPNFPRAGNLDQQASDDLEVEQRLSPEHVKFDQDVFTSQENLDIRLETREIERASEYGLRKMNELVNVMEPELYTKGLWLKPDSSAGRLSAFSAPGAKAQRLARYGYAAVQASTKLLQQWIGGFEGRAGPLLRLPAELRGSLRGTKLQRQCRVLNAPTPCRAAARRYRTADGSCNNLQRPRFGQALTPLQRFLAPRYVDGVQGVRTSLPSPRLVSTRIHRPRHVESPSITLMLMQWGQLIDHDITSTPSSRAFNGSTPRCCGDGGRSHLPQHLLHPECLPITVPSDDPILARFNIRCMEFIRSAPVPREDCDFGHRQQMNQVTSYLDASTIYGSSTSQADGIRLFRGGLIRFGTPDPPNGGEPCRLGAVSAQCLRPGDARASEQPALTALHIIWVRLHNQIASEFDSLNPHWSDEKLYQETRRLISAVIQHITYREFLPIVLGHEVIRLFDLELLHKGYYKGYDQRVNPSPANSFSAAAYRFGHSMVQDSFVRSDRFHRPIFNNVSLHDEQSNTDNIWSPGSVDRLVLGLINQPSQKRDEFISVELTNHLFQAPGSGSNGFGLDLAAINIQRGRDHGLPTYTAWREPCGLSPVRNWTDLQRVMTPETAERFRSIFLSVDDIDLYSAGLAERPVRGGIVGPTFACIIAQQFSNLRKGDRFWYENGNFESSFTSSQLQQIRKLTFAQIICQTMPEIETVQSFVFLTPDNLQNRRELCSNFDFDLTPWIENEDQSFPQPNQSIFENAVEKKHEDSSRDKNAKIDSEDVFSFSMPAFKLKTDQKPTTDEILKQTIFRRDKRQTKQLTNHKNKTRPDNIEHRELLNEYTDDMLSLTLEVDPTDMTDLDDPSRRERKRKRPTRTKNKSKPSTQRPVSSTKKNKIKNDLKYFYGQDHSGSGQYYTPTYSNNQEVVIGTKRPQTNNQMTYLFNTVRKTTTTTTPLPDYQFHIQINYFYNTTTERSRPRPTQPTNIKRPVYNYDQTGPNYNYNQQASSNYYYNPYTTTSRYNYDYSSTPNYLTGPGFYSTDRIDYGPNRFPTKKPVSSNPITVIEINPQTIQRPETNRPNIYIVGDFDSQKPTYDYNNKPTYDYNNYKPTYDFNNNKPVTFDTQPDTLIYKRPMTGHITKLDKPVVYYDQPQNYDQKPLQYGTEVVYDTEYLANKRRPTYFQEPTYSNVDDKLDFNKNTFVKITHQIITSPKPYDDDKRFVRISSVKGHSTHTDSLSPVYINVQNKESTDDLEMTYDDILEVYMKSDEMSASAREDSDETTTLTPNITETQSQIPIDDPFDTELPRPMDLFINDDLL